MPERENFMKLRSSKVATCAGAAIVMLLMPVIPAIVDAKTTNEQQQSTQLETNIKQASYTENVSDIVAAGYEEYTETDMYAGMAIAVADPYINVYMRADDASEVVGRMYKDGIAGVVEMSTEWTKISSGNVSGFVKTSALCFDEEAADIGSGKAEVVVSVTAQTADVYSSADAKTKIKSVENGAAFSAIAKCGSYISIVCDDAMAYVSAEDVTVSYGLSWGYTNAEAEEKEAAEEAARVAAEEARLQAEAEARHKAEEAAAAEAARIQAAMASVEISYNPTMQVSDEEVWILACVIDWEAGWESYEGKLAVANIVLNRVRSPYYANSVTGVVYARSQFSGVSDGNGNPSERFAARLAQGPRTDECLQAAMEALSGINNIGSYTSFRALYAANYGAYASYTIIGNHCFF